MKWFKRKLAEWYFGFNNIERITDEYSFMFHKSHSSIIGEKVIIEGTIIANSGSDITVQCDRSKRRFITHYNDTSKNNNKG